MILAAQKKEQLQKEAALMMNEYIHDPEIQEWIEFEEVLDEELKSFICTTILYRLGTYFHFH